MRDLSLCLLVLPSSPTFHPAALSFSFLQEASLCACMCVAWHSHRLHNIAVFPVNRMSGRTANHPRLASPLPLALPFLAPLTALPCSPVVVRPRQPEPPRTLTANLFPAARSGTERIGEERRGEARPAEKENRSSRARTSERAS